MPRRSRTVSAQYKYSGSRSHLAPAWHGPAPAGTAVRPAEKTEIRKQLMRRSRGQVVRILNEADIRYKRGRKGSRINVHVGSKGRVHGLRKPKKLSPNSKLAHLNAAVARAIKAENADYKEAVRRSNRDARLVKPWTSKDAAGQTIHHPGNIAFLTRLHLMKIVAGK